MKQSTKYPTFLAGLVLGFILFQTPIAYAAAPASKPFQAYVSAGATYDDNLFRLEGGSEGEQLLGTRELDDWYTNLKAGFDTVIALDNQGFELQGNIFRQVYDRYDDFDHTGGRFRGAWEWKASDVTSGNLGYRFRHKLRNFSNADIPSKDIIEEHAVFGTVEQRLADRWLLRTAGDYADLDFSTTPLLDKRRLNLEAEFQYAASQRSTFGLLTAYTRSKFDRNQAQDFSGWSVGPSASWQYTPDLKITANVSYTHQGLDESLPGTEDFDGVTGFVAADWKASDRLNWKLRLFRDISDLGGEIPQYTKRTGVKLIPVWKISAKLTSRAEFTYEKRDFVLFSTTAVPQREDDYYLASLWLDLEVARRWLLSAGISRELKDSNVQIREFDDTSVHAVIRFDL